MRTHAMVRLAAVLVVSGGILAACGLRGHAVGASARVPEPRYAGGQTPVAPSSPRPLELPEHDEHDASRDRMKQQAILTANQVRHKRMVADANKLLDLSTQLKDDVDKTADDELSVEVIRKATEIEKLAHDVRERMRQ